MLAPRRSFIGARKILVAIFVSLVCCGAVAQAAMPANILIPGPMIFPESLTSTPNGTLIIGSIGRHAIYRAVPASGVATPWITAQSAGIHSIFGVLADMSSNTLWACSNILASPGARATASADLDAFDLKSGSLKAHYAFPSSGSLCNDISISRNGSVYATDTNNMEVVRLRNGAKKIHVWAGKGAFGPRGSVLDGIVVLKRRVIVGTLATNDLFSIPILADGKSGRVTKIKLSHPLSHPDGIRPYSHNVLLIAEQGEPGRLLKLALRGNAAVVTTVKEGIPGDPDAVTVVNDTAYVLEGQLNLLIEMMQGKPVQPRPFRAIAVRLHKR